MMMATSKDLVVATTEPISEEHKTLQENFARIRRQFHHSMDEDARLGRLQSQYRAEGQASKADELTATIEAIRLNRRQIGEDFATAHSDLLRFEAEYVKKETRGGESLKRPLFNDINPSEIKIATETSSAQPRVPKREAASKRAAAESHDQTEIERKLSLLQSKFGSRR